MAHRLVAAVVSLLCSGPLWAQDAPPPAAAAVPEVPAADANAATPPPTDPAAPAPEAAAPEEPPAAVKDEDEPRSEMDPGVAPVDPSAPLERFRRGMRRPSVEEDAPRTDEGVAPPPVSINPVTDVGEGGARKGVQLRLKNGETVEGEVVSETQEGWAIKLPTGETRFYDRLDVVSDNVPKAARPSWAHKALLAASLLWPGAGQLLYGAVVQKGQPWERSALVVGAILAAVTVGGLMVLGAGVVAGLALPAIPVGGVVVIGGPLNPITLAGAVAVVLAMAVALLDAGARAILD